MIETAEITSLSLSIILAKIFSCSSHLFHSSQSKHNRHENLTKKENDWMVFVRWNHRETKSVTYSVVTLFKDTLAWTKKDLKKKIKRKMSAFIFFWNTIVEGVCAFARFYNAHFLNKGCFLYALGNVAHFFSPLKKDCIRIIFGHCRVAAVIFHLNPTIHAAGTVSLVHRRNWIRDLKSGPKYLAD